VGPAPGLAGQPPDRLDDAGHGGTGMTAALVEALNACRDAR
jgi:hypothetical protein